MHSLLSKSRICLIIVFLVTQGRGSGSEKTTQDGDSGEFDELLSMMKRLTTKMDTVNDNDKDKVLSDRRVVDILKTNIKSKLAKFNLVENERIKNIERSVEV